MPEPRRPRDPDWYRNTEPVDPDVDLRSEAGAASPGLRHPEWWAVGVVALGGVGGSLARYEAGVIWPTASGSLPWTTVLINVVGCALIGILTVLTTDVFAPHWLVRRALGTGVLGGFTTFSAYAVDTERLIATGHSGTALGYLAVTLLGALAAVTASTRATRAVFAARITRRASDETGSRG